MLSILFSVKLRWLPIAGIETIASGKTGFSRALDIAQHLALPVGALALIYLALFLRVMRSGMAEAWKLDFVLFARAKGLSRGRIVLRHVARNALLPLVTMLGLQSAAMLGGSVVIEEIFNIPGLGALLVGAIHAADAALVQAIAVATAAVTIGGQALGDAIVWLVDPRVRRRAVS